MNNPSAALLIIGDEVLSGRTQDVHVAYLAQKLKNIGVSLSEVRIVTDDQNHIISSVQDLAKQYDSLFTTGGIGATHDDVTINAVSQALGLETIVHPKAFNILSDYYQSQNLPFTSARQLMARAPKGASIIPNPVSGAPGFHIQNLYILAGIPSIAHAMIDHVIPSLKNGIPLIAQTLRTNLPESSMRDAMEYAAESFSVKIGSYPSHHRKFHGVSIVVKSHHATHIKKTLDFLLQRAKQLGGDVHLLDGEH
jgi:molybdenum cofactor synthesis domain-containing protein